jgi:hypothetical protein
MAQLELRRRDTRLRDLDRAIAEGLGGRIAVDSRVGEGTLVHGGAARVRVI